MREMGGRKIWRVKDEKYKFVLSREMREQIIHVAEDAKSNASFIIE